jgi:phage head maturation protease
MQATEAKAASQKVSHRIIEALASVVDSDPLTMSPTLYEVIDPDALDRLLDTDQHVELTFEYDGHTVVADSDGRVSVDGVTFEPDDRRAVFGQQ